MGKKKRKYRHLKGQRDYRKGSILNNNIDAGALEAAVFDLIAAAAADAPEIERRIEMAIREQASAPDAEKNLVNLEARRAEVTTQTQGLYLAHPDDREDLEAILTQLRVQRRELTQQIDEKRRDQQRIAIDPAGVVAKLQERMKAMTGADIAALPPAVRRELVQAFVERVEVNMETRDAEVHLRLPPWALESATEASGGGRLAPPSPSPTSYEATPGPGRTIRLAWADCRYVHVPGSRAPVCYECRRNAA